VEGFSIQDASLQESVGPVQDYSREFLVPTDKAIVMARRVLHRAVQGLERDLDPPALSAASQRVRSASVVLDKSISAKDWAAESLVDGLAKPVYTV
jgi:phthalate 4,5-dioxygenase oxygenase subunit